MSKKGLWCLSGLVVCGAAVAAIINSQSALAQQKQSTDQSSQRQRPRTDSGAVLISSRRIRPSDPTFRWAIAAVVDPVREKVLGKNFRTDMPGSFVFSETIKEHQSSTDSWFHKTIFFMPPGLEIRVRDMTAAELAMAETLFKDMDLSRARNLEVTRDGITGTVTARELGVRSSVLVERTKSRLADSMRVQTQALNELSR